MACRHLMSPGHYLVDPNTWTWSPNGHSHGHEWHTPPLLFKVNQPPTPPPPHPTPILRYSYFKIWPWKSMVNVMCVAKGQGHIWTWKFKGQGQTHWWHLRTGVQSIYLPFVSWQWDHFWLRYSKFHIWPWKFKVKVMAKVKPDGHIWGLGFNQYVCFSFRGNRTMFAFHFVAIGHFWLRYSKFYIWYWKFKVKVKVKAKVTPDGHVWGLEFNRYVCFLFRGNWIIFGWDIANSIFELENSRSRSGRKSTTI